MQEQVSRRYVGIDLHRRRSVIVRMDEAGKGLGMKRALNTRSSSPLPWPNQARGQRWRWKRPMALTTVPPTC
jgi:hypothetical protein